MCLRGVNFGGVEPVRWRNVLFEKAKSVKGGGGQGLSGGACLCYPVYCEIKRKDMSDFDRLKQQHVNCSQKGLKVTESHSPVLIAENSLCHKHTYKMS